MSWRRRIEQVRRLPREARWKWQRARRGYADVDTWDLGWYLATVLAGSLRQLGQRPMSVPARLVDGYGGDVDAAADAWSTVLLEMANGFHHISTGAYEHDERAMTAARRSLDLLRTWYFDLWD